MSLAGAICHAYQQGRAAWPDVGHPAEMFGRWLVERSIDQSALERNGSDLFLASACAAGEPPAIAAFDRTFVRGIKTAVARVGLTTQLLDELQQALRVRLLTGPSPKIALYRGNGALGAWVRVTAVRLALELKSAGQAEENSNSTVLDALVAGGADPELLAAKAQHREVFNAELEHCFSELDPRDKTVLRMHFVHGLSVEQMSAVLKVHRVTMSRRLAGIRHGVFSRLCQRLSLHVSAGSEMASLIRLVRSDMEVSVHRLLDTSGGER